MITIGVSAPSFGADWKATFDALGAGLGVSFEERTFGDDRNLAGWIVLAATRQTVDEAGRASRPCYVVPNEAELVPCGASPNITFANRSELDALLRSREIAADDAIGAKALPAWVTDVVPLAFKDGSPIWAIRDVGACRHHFVALIPPALEDGEPLFPHFSGQRLACLLPLVLFVRSLTEDPSWERPPLQAAFMFDDPNLHWTSYGFVDYGEMVRHAVAGNYHVSIATIPLDTWFVHPPTGAIFKQNAERISLLLHGNDHLHRELARAQPAASMQRLLRQAVGRIARMESRTGLEVARVMAPPHGACSEMALSEMAGLGFEAVCVSRGSLRHHNAPAAWTRTIGMRPCDIVAGLPVIPRFGLSKNSRNDILIAALLRQPIVPMTHHQALAEGYGLLDETASFVNSLGEVSWRDMKTVSRSLYSRKQENETLRVRMLSKQISVRVDRGTSRIQIERQGLYDSTDEVVFWRTTTGDRSWKISPRSEAIAVQAGTIVEIGSGPVGAARTEKHAAGSRRLAPVARRMLTEVRDRALPSIYSIARSGRSSRLA